MFSCFLFSFLPTFYLSNPTPKITGILTLGGGSPKFNQLDKVITRTQNHRRLVKIDPFCFELSQHQTHTNTETEAITLHCALYSEAVRDTMMTKIIFLKARCPGTDLVLKLLHTKTNLRN